MTAQGILVKRVAGIGLSGALVLGAVWLAYGTLVVQKLVVALAAPCGIIWIGLALLCCAAFAARQRGLLLLSLAVWLLFTLATSSLVSDALLRSLEADYLDQHPLRGSERYDLVIVLGGGTFSGYNGDVQLNDSGDRVVMAARLYHAGKAARIVCTGTKIAGLSAEEDLDPGIEAKQLLESLAVPSSAIEIIPGRNTREEVESLAALVADRSDLRIGLVTSAWHLPRAMRLARSMGLQVEPIPTDFRTGLPNLTPRSFVPSGLALERNAQVFNEYLARLVGR